MAPHPDFSPIAPVVANGNGYAPPYRWYLLIGPGLVIKAFSRPSWWACLWQRLLLGWRWVPIRKATSTHPR